ncbi:uncharacterized protein [Magallana gigas]|uniref:uncharacterized protein n=1 Tax=Magallana gigas TaxID=29159 RepID=UPI0033421D40
MSMVAYNWTLFQGFPVYFKNGTMYKNNEAPFGNQRHSFEETPLSEKEKENIHTVDGNYKFMYAINNQFPGPTVVVYENQTVKVCVYNNLANEAVTLHWHGMFQSKTPWMDGSSRISQCPILPGQMFTYKFIANPPGTHWYHSHHGAMRREGLHGAFIVLPRQGKERTDIPKVDKDVLFLTQDWVFNKNDAQTAEEQNWFLLQFSDNFDAAECTTSRFTYDGSLSTLLRPYNNALINGKSKSFASDSSVNQRSVPLEMFNVTLNSKTRFRIMNTGSTGEYKISFDEHKMLLIATDGYDLSTIWIDYLFINPAETYDVIVFANNTPGNYWIRVQTNEVMDQNHNRVDPNVSFALLHYQEVEVYYPDSKRKECSKFDSCVIANSHWSPITMSKWEPRAQYLSVADMRGPANGKRASPIAVPESLEDFQEVFLNFHFNGSALLFERPAVNAIHFKNPPVPLQVSPEIVNERNAVCNNKDMYQCGEFCRCTHVIKLASKKVTQIVLLNENGISGGPSHPVHLHGNHFHVLKYGSGEINKTTGYTQGPTQDIQFSSDFRSAQWRNSSWNFGNVPGINIENPPKKDTIMVPFRGYVIIRFRTDNPGFWLMHCHLEAHMDIGMAVVLQVGEISEQPKPPKDFPKCSNFKRESLYKPVSKEHFNGFLQLPEVENTTTKGFNKH